MLTISPKSDENAKRDEVVEQAGELLADHLLAQSAPQLLLDMDGVIFHSDSLHSPKLTTPDIIPALLALEAQGIALGPATGRGPHVVKYLRESGLQLSGPAILEEGQTTIQNGVVLHLGHPNHIPYMANMRDVLRQDAEFLPGWNEVREATQRGELGFCGGNFQWQGECINSFWFEYGEDPLLEDNVISTKIVPVLRKLATKHGLNFDRDVAINHYRMQPSAENGNLSVVSIKGTSDGERIHKGTAAENLTGTWGFVADGFGDAPIAKVTKARQGVVIGIEGNLDITDDAPEFLQISDVVLKDPEEFARSLRHATRIIQSRK